jgi:hypothetical protein
MLCATNSHLFKAAHHIVDSLFSARVTTPLSFSAIRLIALRTRRAGCIPARAAGALVLKLKYCCAWFIAGTLFPFVTSMVSSALPSELRLQSQKQMMEDSDMISTRGEVSRKITFPFDIFCVPLVCWHRNVIPTGIENCQ